MPGSAVLRPMALLASIKQVCEHIAVAGDAGDLDTLLEQASRRALGLIAEAGAIDMTVATSVITEIMQSRFNATLRAQLFQAINQQVDWGMGMARKVDKKQTCLNFHRYLDQDTWTLLRDPNTTWPAAFQALVTACERLGLMWPSPATILHIVCTAFVASAGASGQVHIDPADALNKERELKNVLVTMRKRTKMPHYGKVGLAEPVSTPPSMGVHQATRTSQNRAPAKALGTRLARGCS